MIKDIIYITSLATAILITAIIYYRKGVEAAEFDQAVANIKLQNCNEVILKFKL